MRPGVPWNVKGIEAEAREAAQLAARRAGVSLGDYLTQLIMTEGRGGGSSAGYSQGYAPAYQPGDGTYGPQPVQQYQAPLPSVRYPHAVPQPQPQGYTQAFQQQLASAQRYAEQQPRYEQQARYEQQPQYQPQAQPLPRDPLTGAAQQLDAQIRGSEFAVVAHGLRDLADRLENSERRAQAAIATVNQSVAAMQDRIDAAERVKQFADVAFSSAADALAQSARDQAGAFESLENTVRSVQKRMNEIDAGNAQWPSKDAVAKLETALGQLQKRLGELETSKPDPAQKDQLSRLEVTLGQLQKRLAEMEQAKNEFPAKEALTRLEAWISDVRHDVADSEKRSREDISQLAKFMRELGTRVDTTEKNLAQVGNGAKAVTENVAGRLDALEARSASMFDEMRGQLSSIDGRLAQTSAAKGAVQPEAFASLKKSVDGLSERVEQNSKGGVHPEAFAALKRSVDTLSSTFDGLTERLDLVSDPASGPLASPLSAIESTLEALTAKIEDGERRAAESVSTVSNALKTISSRLEDTDKKQTNALQAINRRLDDVERGSSESSRTVEDSLKALTQRLEVSDKRHKEAIGGLRLTVDGLVAKAAADAVPLDSYAGRTSSAPSALSSHSHFTPPPPMSPPPAAVDEPPEFPPFSSTTAKALSGMTPPPPSAFMADPPPPSFNVPPKDDGYSVSALQTIMAGPLSAASPSDLPNIEPDPFAAERIEPDLGDAEFQPKKDDFLTQARRAAKAAAEAEAERNQNKRSRFAVPEDGQSRKLGRLAIIGVAGLAVVAGLIALLFTMPGGGGEDINRPAPGNSIGEILNGPAPSEATPSAASPAEFAPASAADGGAASGAPSVAVEPNGLGVPTNEPAPPSFTAGTSPLPGGPPSGDTTVAALESAAVRGDATAQFVLALRYAEGRGVTKDDTKAASLVTKAAQQGLVVAEYRLGAIYERGVGVPKDLAQAKAWYERAAKGGNRKAMHNLAVLHAEGQNFAEAARWFRQGAEFGLADSQYNLGILLERGMGVEKNANEAAKWYAVAVSQGDTGAAERLELLKRTMSGADVAMALDAARKFQPKPMNAIANEVPAFTG
ncbi:MAG: SEL1-like repeat protein [Alphaproteobacteria bacterium]|nr:SEL1-like repeat protein [Alphaproteobacteria bacterium]